MIRKLKVYILSVLPTRKYFNNWNFCSLLNNWIDSTNQVDSTKWRGSQLNEEEVASEIDSKSIEWKVSLLPTSRVERGKSSQMSERASNHPQVKSSNEGLVDFFSSQVDHFLVDQRRRLNPMKTLVKRNMDPVKWTSLSIEYRWGKWPKTWGQSNLMEQVNQEIQTTI